MNRFVLPVFALAATAALAGPPDDKKPAKVPADSIKWATSWDEAIREAKERNVPIHVAYHKDH